MTKWGRSFGASELHWLFEGLERPTLIDLGSKQFDFAFYYAWFPSNFLRSSLMRVVELMSNFVLSWVACRIGFLMLIMRMVCLLRWCKFWKQHICSWVYFGVGCFVKSAHLIRLRWMGGDESWNFRLSYATKSYLLSFSFECTNLFLFIIHSCQILYRSELI